MRGKWLPWTVAFRVYITILKVILLIFNVYIISLISMHGSFDKAVRVAAPR
jgi:hypothetical protein